MRDVQGFNILLVVSS